MGNQVPVVHIVGYPSTQAIKSHAIMHHSLGDGKFGSVCGVLCSKSLN
jgi:TPP-dependent 2-oxoacid decarboxylase